MSWNEMKSVMEDKPQLAMHMYRSPRLSCDKHLTFFFM